VIGSPAVVFVVRDLYGSERELCTTIKFVYTNSSFRLQLLIPQLPVVFREGAQNCMKRKRNEEVL
jgi:hypothetical protein